MPAVVSPVLVPLDPLLLPHIDKQYAAFHDKYLAMDSQVHLMDEWDPAVRTRTGGAPTTAPALQVAEIRDVPLGSFSIRIFYPSLPDPSRLLPVFMWYHCGGMVVGSVEAEAPFCTRVANTAHCAVVSVDYRLAPEHKFPTGSNDAWAAFEYIFAHGKQLGLDTTRLGVGGLSSGGNLAAMITHRAGVAEMKIDFAALGVPVCDNTATAARYPSWGEYKNSPGLPDAKMLWFRDQYLPNLLDRSNPVASPLLAPDEWFIKSTNNIYIANAELDPLRSEGEAYAAKLRSFGKNVQHRVYSGVPHIIQLLDGPVDAGRRWVRDMCAYIAVQFGGHAADADMGVLYPDGTEVGIPRVDGGGAWTRLDRPMVLGEAPLYRASDNTLHYVDCLVEPAQLHVLQLDNAGDATGPPRIVLLADSVSVACFRKNRPGYICAYYQGVAFLDETTGELEVLKEIVPSSDRGIRRFNDGAIDCEGRFWLAEIDCGALAVGKGRLEHGYEPLGRLWRYDPDGSVHLMESGLVCGNGVAWSPDNKTMYLNDSAGGVTWAHDFAVPTGAINNKRLLIDRRDLDGEPDGMVCDVNGHLWIAMYGTNCVMVFDAEGKHLHDVRFPAKTLTCVAWGGPTNDTLYITSAVNRVSSGGDNDEGGNLFRYHANVRGCPKFQFNG